MQSTRESTDTGAVTGDDYVVTPRPPRVVSSAFYLKPATLSEISRALNAMKNTKARGDDGVSLQMLKIVFPVVGLHLLHVVNFSLKSGTVPDDWKMAVVVPLHKKGATDDPKNFRPISLLSNVSKLCEKIVVSQLTSYLMTNGIVNDTQHAYLPGRSTETALASSQFVRRADVSQRRTRAKQNALELPAVKTELARRSLLFRASHLWNRLPDEVTELVSKSLFKSKLPF